MIRNVTLSIRRRFTNYPNYCESSSPDHSFFTFGGDSKSSIFSCCVPHSNRHFSGCMVHGRKMENKMVDFSKHQAHMDFHCLFYYSHFRTF